MNTNKAGVAGVVPHKKPRGGAAKTLRDIHSKCDICPVQGCWVWQGGTNGDGYGIVRHRGRQARVHRLALMLAFGWDEDRPELVAAHGPCHNRGCCNPVHLNWKTTAGNQADKLRDGSSPQGERNGQSKLTAEAVRFIRANYPRLTQTSLARTFGVSIRAVRFVVRGEKWAHVQ
jgi:hypothetical protein